MPIATITNPTERFELKSLPEAYVVIRRMTWGEKLKRQAMMTKFHMQFGDKKQDTSAEIDILQEQVTMWEFMNLVVEHNLEKAGANGQPVLLNLKNAADVSLIDPIVGEEIQKYIDEVNSFEESDDIKN